MKKPDETLYPHEWLLQRAWVYAVFAVAIIFLIGVNIFVALFVPPSPQLCGTIPVNSYEPFPFVRSLIVMVAIGGAIAFFYFFGRDL